MSIYTLREVGDDYSMSKELTVAMACWFIASVFAVFPIDFERYKSLPGLVRNWVLLW